MSHSHENIIAWLDRQINRSHQKYDRLQAAHGAPPAVELRALMMAYRETKTRILESRRECMSRSELNFSDLNLGSFRCCFCDPKKPPKIAPNDCVKQHKMLQHKAVTILKCPFCGAELFEIDSLKLLEGK